MNNLEVRPRCSHPLDQVGRGREFHVRCSQGRFLSVMRPLWPTTIASFEEAESIFCWRADGANEASGAW